MSNLPITQPYNSFTSAVDKQIGDAFPAVEAVAKRIQEIVYLAHHLNDIQPRDIELQAQSDQKELLWRRAGETEWKLLITYADLLGSDLGDVNTTVADAVERIEELERTQSDFWQKTPDPYEAGVVVTSPYYTVTYDGKYYSPNVNALPFFTGLWDADQWRDLSALPGQTTNVSLLPGVKRVTLTMGTTTENAQKNPLTLDGTAITAENTIDMGDPGLYTLDVKILAKDNTMNAWATLVRTLTVTVKEGIATLIAADTPIQDILVGLNDINVTFTIFNGKFVIYAGGQDELVLKWTAFVSINQVVNYGG